jgi:hypothetical protein
MYCRSYSGLVFRRILIAQAMNLGQSGHSRFHAEPLLCQSL